MSILDHVNAALNGFDAKKDNATASAFESLPAGDYNVIVEEVQHAAYDSGFEALQVKTSVLDGDHAGQTDSNNFSVDNDGTKIPDFVIEQNIKSIARLANAVGVTLSDADWESLDTLQDAFMDAKGKTVLMHLTVRPNKKNPDNPNKSYDFEPAEQPKPIDVDDGDLPF